MKKHIVPLCIIFFSIIGLISTLAIMTSRNIDKITQLLEKLDERLTYIESIE
jgi:hypothetical protein